MSAILLIANVALICSKLWSFMDHKKYFQGDPNLPGPLSKRPLQWGVRTGITPFTLLPDLLLPAFFLYAWIHLGQSIRGAALLLSP